MFTRTQRNQLAAAMRDARPYILDSAEYKAEHKSKWLTADTVYTNCCTELARMLERTVAGFDGEEKTIFLSNCRVLKLPPFTCAKCGQHITDGKPCGHGQRDALGIV